MHWDRRNGRIVNSNLADYHIPANADIHDLDVIFVEEDDPHVNPVKAKGLAELSIVGVAAAIANAIYHATGIRVRFPAASEISDPVAGDSQTSLSRSSRSFRLRFEGNQPT